MTEHGTDWVHKRAPLRRAALVFKALTYAEGSTLKEIIRLHDTSSEIVYIPNVLDRAVTQQDGFLARFRELSKLEHSFWEHRGVALGLDERGGAP